mmetsp:Transcript_12151/g.30825  ORF Transcript_12151/g.30825 Transcript_12151/m.30825 type:complete len:201 (-) Transcript_12151:520-1122(-)
MLLYTCVKPVGLPLRRTEITGNSTMVFPTRFSPRDLARSISCTFRSPSFCLWAGRKQQRLARPASTKGSSLWYSVALSFCIVRASCSRSAREHESRTFAETRVTAPAATPPSAVALSATADDPSPAPFPSPASFSSTGVLVLVLGAPPSGAANCHSTRQKSWSLARWWKLVFSPRRFMPGCRKSSRTPLFLAWNLKFFRK